MRLRGDRQQDLAIVLGVVRPAITARMNNKSPWALDDLDALAAHYGVPPATFLVPAHLLLGGGGLGGDQGTQLVPPLDVAALMREPESDGRKRRQRGVTIGPRGGMLDGSNSRPRRRSTDPGQMRLDAAG